MAWQSDLADHIAANFVDPDAAQQWVAGTSVVIGPPEDDDGTDDFCIGLVDRPGPNDETYGHVYGRPNLTIVVRSPIKKPAAAHDTAQALYLWLTSREHTNFQMGSTPMLRFEPLAWPGRLRRDSKLRTDVTMEIGVWLGEL